MIAFVKDGGRQIKVRIGDSMLFDKKNKGVGENIVFDQVVLLIDQKGTSHIGMPYLKGVSVVGKIVKEVKDKEITVFKKKRRKRYSLRKNHRQVLTQIYIEDIIKK